MKEVLIKDKQAYFDNNYLFDDFVELMDKRKCIHCDSVFYVGEFKVFINDLGHELICCPNAPECDGTIIDWVKV